MTDGTTKMGPKGGRKKNHNPATMVAGRIAAQRKPIRPRGGASRRRSRHSLGSASNNPTNHTKTSAVHWTGFALRPKPNPATRYKPPPSANRWGKIRRAKRRVGAIVGVGKVGGRCATHQNHPVNSGPNFSAGRSRSCAQSESTKRPAVPGGKSDLCHDTGHLRLPFSLHPVAWACAERQTNFSLRAANSTIRSSSQPCFQRWMLVSP